MIQYLKNIKMPVFRLFLFSGLGYLGYIFYQDYRYRQLLNQIHESNKSSHSNTLKQTPLTKLTKIIQKIDSCQSKYQLKYLFKDVQINIEKYWIDPLKRKNLIDFKVRQVPKSQNQQTMWWLKHYIQKWQYWTNYYQRLTVEKQGTFGIGFWLDLIVKQKHEVLQCEKVQGLIEKVLKLREKKCLKFTLQQDSHNKNNFGSTHTNRNDEEFIQCLKQTQMTAVALQKMKQRLKIISKYQY